MGGNKAYAEFKNHVVWYVSEDNTYPLAAELKAVYKAALIKRYAVDSVGLGIVRRLETPITPLRALSKALFPPATTVLGQPCPQGHEPLVVKAEF